MYIVQELQVAQDGTVAFVPPTQHATRNEADQAYYYAVSFAAVSTVPRHTIIMYNDEGNILSSHSYLHEVNSEPEED